MANVIFGFRRGLSFSGIRVEEDILLSLFWTYPFMWPHACQCFRFKLFQSRHVHKNVPSSRTARSQSVPNRTRENCERKSDPTFAAIQAVPHQSSRRISVSGLLFWLINWFYCPSMHYITCLSCKSSWEALISTEWRIFGALWLFLFFFAND